MSISTANIKIDLDSKQSADSRFCNIFFFRFIHRSTWITNFNEFQHINHQFTLISCTVANINPPHIFLFNADDIYIYILNIYTLYSYQSIFIWQGNAYSIDMDSWRIQNICKHWFYGCITFDILPWRSNKTTKGLKSGRKSTLEAVFAVGVGGWSPLTSTMRLHNTSCWGKTHFHPRYAPRTIAKCPVCISRWI